MRDWTPCTYMSFCPVHIVFMLEFDPLFIQVGPQTALLDFLLARMDLWLGGDPAINRNGELRHQRYF